MKTKITAVTLIHLFSAVLTLCMSARNQTAQGQDSSTTPEPGSYVRGYGVGPPAVPPPVLIQAIIRDDGTVDGFRVLECGSSIGNGDEKRLRIEMMDGSIREIEMGKIKKITIEQKPGS